MSAGTTKVQMCGQICSKRKETAIHKVDIDGSAVPHLHKHVQEIAKGVWVLSDTSVGCAAAACALLGKTEINEKEFCTDSDEVKERKAKSE